MNEPKSSNKDMVFNTTLINISVVSWRSVLLVEETGIYREKTTDLSQVTDKLYHIVFVVSSTPYHERGSNSQR
jgi:hypothetical protein